MAGKKELAKRVLESGSEYGMNLAHAQRVVDMTLKAIVDLVNEGQSLQLRGFGNFKFVDRDGFVRKSPIAGNGEMVVPPRKVLKFRSFMNRDIE